MSQVGKGNVDRPGNSLHFRYDRYLRELRHLSTSEMRIAHVDIGCGAGAFSWAFLDKVRALGIKLDSVDLYGLDYCPAMICLAKEIRAKLKNTIPDYPDLRYCENVETLLQNLSEGWGSLLESLKGIGIKFDPRWIASDTKSAMLYPE